MITLRFHGQAGNQLIEHLFCKVLADKTGMAYQPPPYLMDKEYWPLQWTDEPLFQLTPSEGRVVRGTPQAIKARHWFDFSTVDPNRPIIVREGFFQRWELFAPYLDKIRGEWLKIEPRRFMPTDDEAVYCHVRRTDYVTLADGSRPDQREKGAASSLEEFAWCLREFPGFKRLVLVTDAPDDPFLREFIKLGEYEIRSTTWDADFMLLASARNVVISQSTFSWLASLLGRAAKIVCPCPAGSFWRRGLESREQPDLFLPVDTDREWVWCLDANDRLRSVRVSTSQPAIPR